MTKSQVRRIKEINTLAAACKAAGDFDGWLRHLEDVRWVLFTK